MLQTDKEESNKIDFKNLFYFLKRRIILFFVYGERRNFVFRTFKRIFASLCICTLTFLGQTIPTFANSTKDIYRLYNPKTTEHFFTASENEKNTLYENGWWYEGVGFRTPTTGNPVYRLVKNNAHFYTASKAESNNLTQNGWKEEGVVFYSAAKDEIPVYRLYNSKLPTTGSHQFLTSQAEVDSLVNQGWTLEGTAWYAQENGSLLANAQKKEPSSSASSNSSSSGGGTYTSGPINIDVPNSGADFAGTNDKYVLNRNTGKFHRVGCSSVKQMKAANAETTNSSRDQIIARGFVPCKKCNP